MANNEDTGILDNRAATYCKLKQYSQARADARAMVKLAPNDDRVSIHLNAYFPIVESWLTLGKGIPAIGQDIVPRWELRQSP